MTAAALAAALLAGCGSSAGGGGGVAYTGGSPGGICDPAVSGDACALAGTGTLHVRCDAASKTWVEVTACTGGSYCVEIADVNAPPKKTASCSAANTSVDAVSNDGTGAGDLDATGGDTTTESDGAASTDAPTSDVADFDSAGVDVADTLVGEDTNQGTDTWQDDSWQDNDTWSQDTWSQDTWSQDTWQDNDTSDPDSWNPDTWQDSWQDTVSVESYQCLAVQDQAFMNALNSSAVAQKVAGVVKDCTLTQGCLVKATENEVIQCIQQCISANSYVQGFGASENCVGCLAAYKGNCGVKKCLAVCAVDANSSDCTSCLASNCDPAYYACVGGGSIPGDGGSTDTWGNDTWGNDTGSSDTWGSETGPNDEVWGDSSSFDSSDGFVATYGCQGHCGGSSKTSSGGTCYCDSICSQQGDCCVDYTTYCK